MHKEKYILADMQIIEFENEDVITASGGGTGSGGQGSGGQGSGGQDTFDFGLSQNEIEII